MSRGGGFLAFLFGFAAGIAASYWYCDKKHRMRADAEIESVKEAWSKRYKREHREPKEEEKTEIGASRSSIDMDRPPKQTTQTPYSTKERAVIERERAENEYPRDDEREEYDETDPPFEITADDYMMSSRYEHVPMTWYKKDDTLIYDEYVEDEDGMNDAIAHDQASIVGDVFEKSGFKDNDVFVIYIRNPRTSTDYEITKSNGGYLV